MRLFLAILCLVLASLVCSTSFAQCAGGSCSLPGTRLTSVRAIRPVVVRRGGRLRILPRNR